MYQILDYALSDPANKTRFTLVYANLTERDGHIEKRFDNTRFTYFPVGENACGSFDHDNDFVSEECANSKCQTIAYLASRVPFTSDCCSEHPCQYIPTCDTKPAYMLTLTTRTTAMGRWLSLLRGNHHLVPRQVYSGQNHRRGTFSTANSARK